MRGIVLGVFATEPDYDYRTPLAEIRATGAPWVSLCVNYYQLRADSTEIGIAEPHTPSDQRLAEIIADCRALGFRVLLFPIVLISQPEKDDWRGTLAPADRAAWFRSYGDLVARLAGVAERTGVSLFSIGSELLSLETDRESWLAIIAAVRSKYSGALTYSANWDSLAGPAFLDALDCVGVTTYFSLTTKNDPSIAELCAAWEPYREDLLVWQAHLGLPLIFTEVGFASQDGNNKDPWNYFISERVDLGEQRDCFEAFNRVWLGEGRLAGAFFYNWFGDGGPSDTGYALEGKPGLAVVRQWFEGLGDKGREGGTP